MKRLSKKQKRQHTLRQLISEKKIDTQDELKAELSNLGIEVTQSSLSRDLNEIGIIKAQGQYQLPTTGKTVGVLPPILSIKTAGSNLMVLKTHPSMAPAMGALIDEHAIKGVAGTIAGDDTIFVAIAQSCDREKLVTRLRRIFN